jgi:hypothetical protein
MLWNRYVFRRGGEVHDMWHDLFASRRIRLSYIAGRGFDLRAVNTLRQFVRTFEASGAQLDGADLLLLRLPGYHLSTELHEQTTDNANALEEAFSVLGRTRVVAVRSVDTGEEDISASNALQMSVASVLENLTDHTDIILDVSSLPRVTFLSLLTGLLARLIPNKSGNDPLNAGGVNLQVVVADDPNLDARIKSEDPSGELVTIPGFSSALHQEAVQDWPLVWFPILGENRVGQLRKVASEIPKSAEICPVLPHPSRDPRRADRLLLEYKELLFDNRRTPTGNILYAHEVNPFEAYRQLLQAMRRYLASLEIIGGSRLIVTPLSNKLMTVAAGLACFEIRPGDMEANYRVGMPYAEATRYTVARDELQDTMSELCALLLTGEAYQSSS